jgi:hypothetical protein
MGDSTCGAAPGESLASTTGGGEMVKRFGVTISALSLLFLAAIACDRGQELAPEPAPDPDLETLVAWMTGSFSSEAQAEGDEAFHDIRLRMARVWTDRDDGAWLYVEQAAASALDRPYRQRVYHVTRLGRDVFESRVLSLPEPARYVGAWRESDPLDDLGPDDLSPRTGCAVLLRKMPDGTYDGGTLGRRCESSLRGASYATSEVTVFDRAIVSWDRGFDGNGVQVWGAETGGYVFDRVE